jgi:hypothetical protein
VPVSVQPASGTRLGGCSFPIGMLKNDEWLRPRMRQYRSTTNDMSKAIREIGFKSVKNLTAKGT